MAVVTGAGRGFGEAYARHLASLGAKVVVNDNGTSSTGEGSDPSVADAVAESIAASGATAIPDHNDVATAAGATSLVAAAIEAFGRIDAVVNNAGISWAQPFSEMTPDDFDVMVRTNLYGPFHVTRAVWDHLVAQGGGRIVNTASAAVFGFDGRAHYTAAKAGVMGLTRALAIEGRASGIGVNVVLPWGVTRLSRARAGRFGEWVAANLTPAGLAPAVAWLCHPSCPVSGEAFTVEGGRMARVALATSAGHVSTALTADDYRDNADAVLSLEAAVFPTDTNDHLQRVVLPALGYPASG